MQFCSAKKIDCKKYSNVIVKNHCKIMQFCIVKKFNCINISLYKIMQFCIGKKFVKNI